MSDSKSPLLDFTVTAINEACGCVLRAARAGAAGLITTLPFTLLLLSLSLLLRR